MQEIKVLLVDDEEEFSSALAERLRLRGIGVATASSGGDALRKVAVDPPQVVVLDMMMPGLSGREILGRLRSAHPEIGVILLTGHGSIRCETVDAEGAGFCDWLMKPVAIEELIEKIRSAAGSGSP